MIGRATQFSLPPMPENCNALPLCSRAFTRRTTNSDAMSCPDTCHAHISLINREPRARPSIHAESLSRSARACDTPGNVNLSFPVEFGSRPLSATFANTRSHFDGNGFSCDVEVALREARAPDPRAQKPIGDLASGLKDMLHVWGVTV